MQSIHRSFAIMKATAFVTFKEWAAYRSHMAVTLFVGPVYFLIQSFIWSSVYSTRTDISGFDLKSMLTYYGVMTVIGYFTFDFADWNLQMLIRSGKFTTFLLRPISHIYFALSQKIGHRLLSVLIEFIPIYIVFAVIFKINLVPKYLLLTIASIALSFILAFEINYCLGTLAFWFTRTSGFVRTFQFLKEICAGMVVPLTLFPLQLQKILFFLPFQFISFAPARVFIGSYELGGINLDIPIIVAIQFIYVLAVYLIYRALWHFGVKRFTGVGG